VSNSGHVLKSCGWATTNERRRDYASDSTRDEVIVVGVCVAVPVRVSGVATVVARRLAGVGRVLVVLGGLLGHVGA
jgi:hypothetical protein